MKRIIVIIAAAIAVSGCAAKRYDTATKIKSETTITQDSAQPITFEAPVVPMVGQPIKQAVGYQEFRKEMERRSLNGKRLIEVKFVHRDGPNSVLEVIETGERFKVKGNWGSDGELFKIER